MGILVLQPTGIMLGATGLSTSYEDTFPPELEGVLSELEWLEATHRINRGFQDRFPCVPCRLQAYCCCPCTLGLSLLTIHGQAKDIEKGGREVISYVNQNLKARKRELRFDLKRKWCRSWIEVQYESAATSFGRTIVKTDDESDPRYVVIREQPLLQAGKEDSDNFVDSVGSTRGRRPGNKEKMPESATVRGGSGRTLVRGSGSYGEALI